MAMDDFIWGMRPSAYENNRGLGVQSATPGFGIVYDEAAGTVEMSLASWANRALRPHSVATPHDIWGHFFIKGASMGNNPGNIRSLVHWGSTNGVTKLCLGVLRESAQNYPIIVATVATATPTTINAGDVLQQTSVDLTSGFHWVAWHLKDKDEDSTFEAEVWIDDNLVWSTDSIVLYKPAVYPELIMYGSVDGGTFGVTTYKDFIYVEGGTGRLAKDDYVWQTRKPIGDSVRDALTGIPDDIDHYKNWDGTPCACAAYNRHDGTTSYGESEIEDADPPAGKEVVAASLFVDSRTSSAPLACRT